MKHTKVNQTDHLRSTPLKGPSKFTTKHSKFKKTFLTDVTMNKDYLVVELLLIDSHYEGAFINQIEDILSMTVVSDVITVVEPFVSSEKRVRFITQAPSKPIEVITINTPTTSIEIEI